MKVHLNSEQFDGHMHSHCGRGNLVVYADEFEATDPINRCFFCSNYWFPRGQPEWHLRFSKEIMRKL